jgi:hypothetical protein
MQYSKISSACYGNSSLFIFGYNEAIFLNNFQSISAHTLITRGSDLQRGKLTSYSVGQSRVASAYFLQASSSNESFEESESGSTLSALSCNYIEKGLKNIGVYKETSA